MGLINPTHYLQCTSINTIHILQNHYYHYHYYYNACCQHVVNVGAKCPLRVLPYKSTGDAPGIWRKTAHQAHPPGYRTAVYPD